MIIVTSKPFSFQNRFLHTIITISVTGMVKLRKQCIYCKYISRLLYIYSPGNEQNLMSRTSFTDSMVHIWSINIIRLKSSLRLCVVLQNGQTALMLASEQGSLEIVQELIRRGASINLDDIVSSVSHFNSKHTQQRDTT